MRICKANSPQGERIFKERGSRLLFSFAKTNFSEEKLRHNLSLNGVLWILSVTTDRKYHKKQLTLHSKNAIIKL